MDQGGVTVDAPVSAIVALATAPVQSVAGRTGAVTLAVADVSGAVSSSDSRLSDAREWSAATATQAEAEAGTSTSRLAFTPQRVFQGIAAWWAASAAKGKLDGVASGATANSSDAILLARANHTGTQAASTISGLATVATTGAYGDLSGRPTAFDPASPGAIGGTAAAAATFTSLTATGRVIQSVNGAASAPPVSLTGTWFSGGTATTTKPQYLIEPAGTTSTAWSTAGTGLGVNAPSGFTGKIFDFQLNGTSLISFEANGSLGIGVTSGATARLDVRRSDASHSLAVFQQSNSSFNCDLALNHTVPGGQTLISKRLTGELWFYISTAHAHVFYTNSIEQLSISSAGLLAFKGKTASFPGLKSSSATLQVRLADDSDYTTIDALHRLQGSAPSTATSTGTTGDIRSDGSYIYVCTATNTWKRANLTTW